MDGFLATCTGVSVGFDVGLAEESVRMPNYRKEISPKGGGEYHDTSLRMSGHQHVRCNDKYTTI